jgi:hypothetical protein
MTHEPSTDKPDRQGVAARLLVPGFWGAVSIVAMWLAVMFDGIFGGDMVFGNNAGNGPTIIPSAVLLGCSPSSARRPSPSASSAAGTSSEPCLDGSAIRAMRHPAAATHAPVVQRVGLPRPSAREVIAQICGILGGPRELIGARRLSTSGYPC